MVKESPLSFEDLDSVLSYSPETGGFVWKQTVGTRSKAGNRAGVWQRMHNGKDYYSITYKGRKLAAGQVAWLLHHGEWPDRSVFYIDGDPCNLRMSNLKLADHKANRVTGDDGKVRYVMSDEQARHYGLRRNYSLTLTEYAQMFAEQDGVCAVCKKPETAKLPGRKKTKDTQKVVRDLSVDHDHKTGAVRGLLCNQCNHMLGAVNDDESVLLSAVEYLRLHRSKQREGTSDMTLKESGGG